MSYNEERMMDTRNLNKYQVRKADMRIRPILLTPLLMLILMTAMVTSAQATKYAGAFMENGGGARALGMGGAFTAIADDPSATFWNPAGIASVSEKEILVMHSERFGDLIDRDFVAYTQPVSWNIFGGESSGVGISLIRLGVDDIPFTDHLTEQLDTNGDGDISDDEARGIFGLQDQIRYKSDQELGFLLSYGEQIGAWQIGGNLKFVRQSVGEYSSIGLGVDLGIMRPRIWRNLDFGVKFQDITTTYLSWSTGRNELVTPAIVPGVAYHIPMQSWGMHAILAASLETRFDNRQDADQYWMGSTSSNSHVGLELGFSDRVYLRGGFDSGWEAGNMTAGAGFKISPLTIDYAYAGDSLDIDEVTHRISLSFLF
jgi:hypothetical protein